MHTYNYKVVLPKNAYDSTDLQVFQQSEIVRKIIEDSLRFLEIEDLAELVSVSKGMHGSEENLYEYLSVLKDKLEKRRRQLESKGMDKALRDELSEFLGKLIRGEDDN